MILKVRKNTDPILREPAEKVVDFDHELQFLIDNMIETMRKNNGVGLAAPQIGFSKKLFICEFEGDKEVKLPGFPLTVICNPEIVSYSKTKKNMVEGCLSFPGLELLIKRPEKITIKGQDRFGNNIEITADKLYGRVLQHEFDHLNSTLFIDHLKEINIIFIGTGTLGTKALELLAEDPQYKIKAVITSTKKKTVSRNKKTTENPIAVIAKKLELPLVKTSNIKDQEMIAKIKKIDPELIIMTDFGQIVPKEILDIPKYGVINIHPSLLPKYRGPSPITQAILDGDQYAGVTLILANEKMDAGDTISQAMVELSKSETTSILKDYLTDIGANLLLNSLPYYMAHDLKPVTQNEAEATYTKIIKPEDAYVFLDSDKETADRKIRAYDRQPHAYTILKNGKRVQLIAGHFEEDGQYVLDRVKPEGKKEMSYQEFEIGYHTKLTFS